MSTVKQSLENDPDLLISNAGRIPSLTSSESESEGEGEQNGARKRKRPMNVTCEACKQRKVRCDRAQPACGWCSRNDHYCEYRERKKPGLRAGYGRELETRLDRLEIIIQEQARQLAAHLEHACSIAGPTTSSTSDPNSRVLTRTDTLGHLPPTYQSTDQSQQQQTIDPQLQPSAPQHRSVQYAPTNLFEHIQQQPQNYQTPASHSQAVTSPQSHSTFQPRPSYSDPTASLPPYDLLYTLADLYFRHINVWFPVLDRKTTLDTLFGPSPLVEADRVLLHAIVAAALRFSKDPRLTIESRIHYHSTSKQKVQLFGLENSSVRALQALFILSLDVTGTTNGPPGWNLLALISRSVIQLGLSIETTSTLVSPLYPSIATLRAAVLPEAKSPIDDEERRRLFWGIYILDRYATIATAFEFALDEREIDRRLPCRDEIFFANRSVETKLFRQANSTRYSAGIVEVHGHFAYHCELLGILGRIHQFLKSPIDIGDLADVERWQGTYRALDTELNAWHFSLPDDFANISRLLKANMPAKPANCGWIMLHAAYCLTMIRLNSSAAYPFQSSAIFSSSYSAMQRCLAAVESMRQLGRLVTTSGLLDKVGPPFAFSVWVCARVMLVHGSTMDHEVDPDIEFFVTLLAEMGSYWAVAQRYSEILDRVLKEYRMSQRVGNVGERVTPSTMKILADMRRCAYDLDFLISRQPHNAAKSYQPTRANTPARNELEYLDIFDLFNFPRIPMAADQLDQVNNQAIRSGPVGDENATNESLAISTFAMPDPDSDWLFHNT